MRILVLSFSFLFIFTSSLPSHSAQDYSASQLYVIRTKNILSTEKLAELKLQNFNIESLSPYSSDFFSRVYRLRADKIELNLIAQQIDIEKIEETFSLQTYGNQYPSDLLFSEQWYLRNQGFDVRYDISDIKSGLRKGVPGQDLGWDKIQNQLSLKFKKPVSVAILDYGVDYEHPELAQSILLNPSECDENGDIRLGRATNDLDGNGYPGDCKGIDLTTKNPTQTNRPLDDQGHGTHLAGIIAAQSNNGNGISGISDQIKILPIKIFQGKVDQGRTSDRLAEAILYAVKRKVDVINMSLGFPIAYDTDYLREAVREAHRQGIFLVAAAGNNAHGVPVYPCAYPEVICVGATQNDGGRASFSNFGGHVDIYAPGDHILSTYPTTKVPDYSVRGFEVLSGTSQAAPMVAAALALSKAYWPKETYDQSLSRVMAARDEEKRLRLDQLFANQQNLEKVQLQFKDTSVVEVLPDGSFHFSVRILNGSDTPVNLNVKVKSLVAGYNIRLANVVPNLQANSSVEVGFVGNVIDLDASLRTRVQIDFQGSHESLSEVLEFALANDLSKSPRVQNLSFPNSKGLKYIASVGTLDLNFPGEHFLAFERVKDATGLSVKLWSRKNYKQNAKIDFIAQVHLERLDGLLDFYQVDIDGDKQDDLMILGLWRDGEAQKLVIYYLNSELQPINNLSNGLVLNEEPNFNFAKIKNAKETKWIPWALPNSGGQILIPSLIESGYTPTLDLSREEQRYIRQSKGRGSFRTHLFYIEPYLSGDSVFLRSRIVDSQKFKDQISMENSLQFYDSISPRALLPDGRSLFIMGSLARSYPLAVKLTSNGVFTERLQWPDAFQGYALTTVNGDQDAQNSLALFGVLSKSRGHLVILDDKDIGRVRLSITVDLPDESEYILRTVILAQSQSEIRLVIESGQKLFGFTYDQSGRLLNTFSEGLVRSTFFGNDFTQVIWPIQLGDGSHQIYVDDTQINARYVWLNYFNVEKGFFTKLSTSFTWPKNCRALNPARWSGEGADRIQALCELPSGLELQSLPLSLQSN